MLHNSKQAMFAAIEIYNKPKFDYREEIFVILLINAWELFLLAILSKNKKRIFQKKKKGQTYKTLEFNSSYDEASKFFSLKPKDIQAIKANLSLMREYRNRAIHYYDDKSIQHAVYSLSQSAIKNYVDVLREIFNEDITNEINIVLLPLSFNNQPNFIEFFKTNKPRNNDFVKSLFSALEEIKKDSTDTSRFITQCSVKIESSRNINSSDLTATYDEESCSVAVKKINPDVSYPLFQKEVLDHENLKIKDRINSYSFQAIAYKYQLKENEKYCWRSRKGGSPRYSVNVIPYLNQLTNENIKIAKEEYTAHLKK